MGIHIASLLVFLILLKQKLLEIKSNFRISLDLFELTILGTNYGLQTANETVTCCPKVALRYFVPLAAKGFLEVIDTLVFFSAVRSYAASIKVTSDGTRH